MKKYKDFGVYAFSDYAEEITGEDLIKINGGSSSCNGGGPGNGGSSAASGGSGSKGSGSSPIGASSGSCGGGGSPSVPSGSGFSTSGSGSGSAPSSGTGSCGGSISSGTPSGYNPGPTPTPQSNPDISDEIKSNPYANAAYMAKQEQAKAEGNPDRYKGYNVLGSGIKTKELKADSMNNETNVNYTNSYKFDFWKEVEDCFDFKIGLRADFQVKIRNNINVGGSINIASIDTEYEPDFYTSGLEGFLAIGNDTVNLIELGGKFEKIAYGSCAFALLEYGTEYEFTPYANYNTKGDVSFTAGIGFVATIHINEILDLGLKSMRSMGFE